MANLKEIRNRISSVSSTMQITSAMKMVSAAKLKKAQDAITAMRPYSDKLTQVLVDLSTSVDFENIYLKPRKVNNKLVTKEEDPILSGEEEDSTDSIEEEKMVWLLSETWDLTSKEISLVKTF